MTFSPSRVQAVFLAALEQENLADRAAVLDRECAADEELRQRVAAILIAHDQPHSFLDQPFIAPSEHIAAILVQPANRADANKSNPPLSDPEDMH